jgi:hypothetical protein
MVSPNSMLFLAENGLDLNQWIMEGIPYTGGDRLVGGQNFFVVYSLRLSDTRALMLTLPSFTLSQHIDERGRPRQP